jgi:APA family basic amino acid/polyamine antiporter
VTSLFRRKPTSHAIAETEQGGLRRTLGAFQLTLLGVGAIVGAGIFSSVGQMAAGSASHPGAGPALTISYLITAVACGFAALCYAEIAAMVPVAGSAYTYSYVALGEVIAWIIGWDLIIEYAIGNIYVAQSWADYLRSFLGDAFGVDFPAWLATNFQTAARDPAIAAHAPHLGPLVIGINLPALFIVALITMVLVKGIRESAMFNAVIVGIKLLLVVGFLAVGSFFIKKENWHPFAPHGLPGIWSGASLAFFSYIGFDAVSTAAEETRNPQRDLPRGMIASLLICTVLYVAVAAVVTGMVPSSELATGDPLARALRLVGLPGVAAVISFGALIAVTAVLLVFQLGQPRIFLAMSRDGLLPPAFGRIHPRYRTPALGTVVTGVFVAVMASILTPDQALELTNIGTLFAFILVAAGVIALRRHSPAVHRPFRCPGYPVTPIIAIVSCLFLIGGLEPSNWIRFVVWLAIGLVIYQSYGRRHSRLEKGA